jgi:hypothetical protein
MSSSENALLVIDMQQGLFRGPASPHVADTILSNICLLMKKPGRRRCQSFLPVTPDLTIPPFLSKVP